MFLAVGGFAFYLMNRNASDEDGGDDVDTAYSKVEIKSLNNSVRYGFVWIDDNEIRSDVSVIEITDFINRNKLSWETESQEYPIGGMSDDGSLWDGSKTVSIGDVDFILAIYVEISDEFSEKYTVDLVE